MALIFMDSFDHYNDLTQKWFSPGFLGSIDTSGSARTGPGCCSFPNSTGPRYVFSPRGELVVGLAWKAPNLAAYGQYQGIISFYSGNLGNVWYLTVQADGTGSIAAIMVNPLGLPQTILCSTGPGVIVGTLYDYVEVKVVFSHLATGSVEIRVNGATVCSASGVVTGEAGADTAQAITLLGLGGGGTLIDDFYLCDTTGGVNDDFLGAVRIYAGVPDGDGTVQWAPSVGITNYPNVDTIPPDPTKYNSSPTSGQADQYIHPLPAGVPSNSQIFGVQHCQCLEVDSGALGVTSDIDGTKSPSGVNLTTGYAIYCWPYDVNPATTNPWSAADFPLLAGPSVV